MGDLELFSMSDDSISVEDEYLKYRLENKNISASMINDFDSCPAKHILSATIMPQYIPAETDSALTRGSFFHSIMEDFYRLPPEERTKDAIRPILRDVSNRDNYAKLAKDREFRGWVKTGLRNYFEMGAQPERVNIAKIEVEGREREGLELFVKAKIGECERDTIGYIDQLSVVDDDGGLQIVDFKTGAKAKIFNKNDRFKSGWSEARQQILYSLMLRKLGYEVKRAGLLFPMVKKVVRIDINDPELVEQAIADVERTDRMFNKMVKNNRYTFGPSGLCPWCPFAKACPKARINRGSDKAMAAYSVQPDKDVILAACKNAEKE